MPPEVAWKVDLHTHTWFSRDCMVSPAALIAAARKADLNRIAVTDHNQIAGALEAQQMAPDLIIVGEEIATSDGGEFIAYFVQELVPQGLPMAEVVDQLRAQGAVISISHPLDRYRGSAMGKANTVAVINQVDALETFNARCLRAEDNLAAAQLAQQCSKLATAGSDGHTVAEIGAGRVVIPPFEPSAQSFLSSLASARVEGRLTGVVPHMWSTVNKMRNRRAGLSG